MVPENATESSSSGRKRFAVLLHRTPPGYPRPDHWDLLLEQPGGLWTWALPAPPERGPAQAQRLPDHRLVYLEYEGPVSGGRGTVTRWDQGEYELLRADPQRLELCFWGEKLRGGYVLAATGSGDYWRWTRSGAPPAD